MALWDDAVKDLKKFNSLYAPVERKPQDLVVLRKCLEGVSKLTKLIKWGELCLTYAILDDQLLPAWKAASKLAKDEKAPAEDVLAAIRQFKKAVQETLDSTAPESFTYQGFKISNKDHLADDLCRKVLAGIDFIKALFKKRGVENLVEEGIVRINLVSDTGGAFAFFNIRTREMTLPAAHLAEGKPGRFFDTLASETILHEFGHYVHENYIRGEAAEAWNAPWEGITDVKDVHPALRKKDLSRKEKLDPLEVVTEYGEVNQYEDFAETFMVFMAAPEKLTPTSKFRMQRALSLSGLYGKPVIRLSSKDEVLALRVAARFTKTV